jgi:D-xylose transport system substrate-binding protein
MALELTQGKPIETQGRVVNNGKRDVPSVLLTPLIVTRDNLDELLIKSGYLSREKVYRK